VTNVTAGSALVQTFTAVHDDALPARPDRHHLRRSTRAASTYNADCRPSPAQATAHERAAGNPCRGPSGSLGDRCTTANCTQTVITVTGYCRPGRPHRARLLRTGACRCRKRPWPRPRGPAPRSSAPQPRRFPRHQGSTAAASADQIAPIWTAAGIPELDLVAAQNGSARVLLGQSPSHTVTHPAGSAWDAVGRLVGRVPTASLCNVCFPCVRV
jgi:hypothetical protein